MSKAEQHALADDAKCPKCGSENITIWMKGEVGYDRRGAHIQYDELDLDVYSCCCGYESSDAEDFGEPKQKHEWKLMDWAPDGDTPEAHMWGCYHCPITLSSGEKAPSEFCEEVA